jgi:hypothetical protein
MKEPIHMAKTPKYPKKLRMTLEKIVSAREAREANPASIRPASPIDGSPFDTLWHHFIPKSSTETMVVRLEDQPISRMRVTYTMRSEEASYFRLFVSPPWGKEDGASL